MSSGASASPGAAAAEAPRPGSDRRLKRLQAAGALATLLIMLGAILVLYRRGSHTVPIPTDPTDAQAPSSCLLVESEGNARVRCAKLVDASARNVWQTIIDYKSFPRLFDSTLWTMKFDTVEDTAEGTHIAGGVSSVVGHWPIDVVMHHTESKDKFVASWDASAGREVNRGAWTVRAAGARAVLIYEIEVRSNKSPAFLINNALLDQVSKIINTVAAAALKHPTPPDSAQAPSTP